MLKFYIEAEPTENGLNVKNSSLIEGNGQEVLYFLAYIERELNSIKKQFKDVVSKKMKEGENVLRNLN